MRWLIGAVVVTSFGVARAEVTQDVVRHAIKDHIRDVMACYEKTGSPLPDKTAVVTFTIAPSGKVTKAVGSGFPAVHDCLADVIRKIQFPRSARSTEVKYPFIVDWSGQ